MEQQQITLKKPFDAHTHWRQEKVLKKILPYTTKQFAGALGMPNTNPKIITLQNLTDYREELFAAINEKEFLPIFTFYLSPELDIEELNTAWKNGWFHGIKYYPKGGTTNSDKGMLGFNEVADILRFMEKKKIPLLIHGETPEHDGKLVDDFKREAKFYKTEMVALRKQFPKLRIVLEHITTKEAVGFVKAHKRVRATITPQHMLFDRRSLFNLNKATEMSYELSTEKSGVLPDFMCRPILKGEKHVNAIRKALIWQAKKGKHKFGLGTDTAYHSRGNKYCECGACGVFTAPIALELYAMAFDAMGILDHLSVFACDVMPTFYGIKDKLPKKTVVLTKKPKKVNKRYYNGTVPFAGQTIPWTAE